MLAAAPPAEPVKCGDCGRLASPTFDACPFCGAPLGIASGLPERAATRPRPMTVPPAPAPTLGGHAWQLHAARRPVGADASEGQDDQDDQDDHEDHDEHERPPSAIASLAAFGLLAGAGLGVWSYTRFDTLVGGGQGLGRVAFAIALGVGALSAQAIVRRYEEEPLAWVAARIGWGRVLLTCGLTTMGLAIPGALAIYGVAMTVNASGTSQTREEVGCVAPTVYRVSAQRRGGFEGRGAAYAVRYTCELRDGVEARGQLALHDEPRVRSGGTMSLVASRGLLGIWLRWGGIVPGSEAGGAKALETQPE